LKPKKKKESAMIRFASTNKQALRLAGGVFAAILASTASIHAHSHQAEAEWATGKIEKAVEIKLIHSELNLHSTEQLFKVEPASHHQLLKHSDQLESQHVKIQAL
jgi:hypothetical protein